MTEQLTGAESSYTRADYESCAREVLETGEIIDRYWSVVADALRRVIDVASEGADVHGFDVQDFQAKYEQAVANATQQTKELVKELNDGIRSYGPVVIRVAREGEVIEVPVEEFRTGDVLGGIHPVFAGEEVTDYTVPGETVYE